MPEIYVAFKHSHYWSANCGSVINENRLQLRFHIRGKRKRYALSGKTGEECKWTRVIPYVRIRHAICRAAANGCVLSMRQTESLHVAIHAAKREKIGWRKLGNP